jgi:hypothetical protein
MPAMFLYTAGQEIGARTELGIAISPAIGLREGVDSGKRCSMSRTWLETSSSAAKAWPDLARFT